MDERYEDEIKRERSGEERGGRVLESERENGENFITHFRDGLNTPANLIIPHGTDSPGLSVAERNSV